MCPIDSNRITRIEQVSDGERNGMEKAAKISFIFFLGKNGTREGRKIIVFESFEVVSIVLKD